LRILVVVFDGFGCHFTSFIGARLLGAKIPLKLDTKKISN